MPERKARIRFLTNFSIDLNQKLCNTQKRKTAIVYFTL